MRTLLAISLTAILLALGCTQADPQTEADEFLSLYNSLYQRMSAVLNDAWWLASTDVGPANDGQRVAAGKAFAAFSGDAAVIERLRGYRELDTQLDDLSRRQLQMAWEWAAKNPGSAPELVAERIEAESAQATAMDGYSYCLDPADDGSCPQPLSANDVDERLRESRDLDERLAVWNASKELGRVLRPGLVRLQGLRNGVAREMGYGSFFELEVANYGMSVDEMMAMLEGWIEDIRPLYLELHTWAKYALAERYGTEVPEMIPAHWLGNRWSQSWPGLVESVDLDALFEGRSAEWVVQQAESFYTSMGFSQLPASFWEKSDLYPVPPGDPRKKNSHASAWHMDLEQDVRSLMSVEPNASWFSTTHHELGHIYYYMAYTRPEIPPLLREGANRGFHEGIGDQIAIASLQVPYLKEVGLLEPDAQIDPVLWLLDEALTQTIVFLPWAAGTITHFERDLYHEDLPEAEWNRRWWNYVERYQGVEAPGPREGDLCDAATKTHINDDPAQYYDYAFATVLKYQLHDHIAREILHQDPTSCNYYGSREVGDFLRSILAQGATRDWRELLREATGSDLSTKPMMEYFAPLMAWLQEQNAGRQKGWTTE